MLDQVDNLNKIYIEETVLPDNYYYDLELCGFGIHDTLAELAEDKIRAFVKEEFDIEFGEMHTDTGIITAHDLKSDTVDLDGVDVIDISFATDPSGGGMKKFSRNLYIHCDVV